MDEKDLQGLKRDKLLDVAKKKNIKGRSRMKKSELVKALLKFFKPQGRKKKAALSKSKTKIVPRKRVLSRKRKPSKPAEFLEKEQVEATKFETPEAAESVSYQEEQFETQPRETNVAVLEKAEIPEKYNEDRLTLLVRDPWWLYAYWEITPQTWEKVRAQIGAHISLKEVLRVYDVTDVPEFRGDNAQSFFDIELTPFANNWYVNVGADGRNYCVDIGLRTAQGEFYKILRSNVVKTPRYSMSDITDEEWMVSEEEYWKMFGLSGGYGIGKGSLEMQELFKKRFEELVSSGFPGSAFSWMPREEVNRGFWLVADAELIIYGATEPGAKLTIQGKPFKLRKDGTFSLRLALPDGEQEVPLRAVSEDGVDEKEIRINVKRRTSARN